MAKTVIIDSDAIFALYNPNDSLNTKTINIFKKLIEKEYQLIYPTSVIFEIISLFQRVLPLPSITTQFVEMIRNDQIDTFIIDEFILKQAAKLFNPNGSKKNTLIDCSVAVIAKKIKAEAVFSYDSFYIKQGLKLAQEI